MKKVKVLLTIGALALATVFSGCSLANMALNSAKKDTSLKDTSVSVATKSEDTKVEEKKKELVILEENGLKVTYKGFDDSNIFPQFNFMIENSSDKSYSISTEDVSINDCMITMGMYETVAAGKKSAVSMSFFESDLEKNDIEKIEKLEFKLHYYNDDNYKEKYDSGVITITNP